MTYPVIPQHYQPAPVPEQPRRSRRPLIIALVVLAVVAILATVASLTVPSVMEQHKISANPDAWYLDQMRHINPGDTSNNGDVIGLGHSLCDAFGQGHNLAWIEDKASDSDLSYSQVDGAARAAVKAYCPNYSDKIN